MTYQNPFAAEGRFYRGNTHTHTTLSDGVLSPADRCRAYREAGYDFLVITDHDVICDVSDLSRDDFLVIPGVELHPPNPYGGDTYHIVALGIRQPIDSRNMHPNEVIAAVGAQGGLACLAHPYWCGHTLTDYASLKGYFAIEVFNDTCRRGIGKGVSESHWDDMLDRLGPTVGIACDDAHKADADVFGGWTMVKAPELSERAILQALQDGAFYSTQAPQFHDIRVKHPNAGEPVLDVTCSPVRSVIFKGRASSGEHCIGQNGQLLSQARHVCKPAEKYIRVELEDPDGKKAWANPFFVAEL